MVKFEEADDAENSRVINCVHIEKKGCCSKDAAAVLSKTIIGFVFKTSLRLRNQTLKKTYLEKKEQRYINTLSMNLIRMSLEQCHQSFQ